MATARQKRPAWMEKRIDPTPLGVILVCHHEGADIQRIPIDPKDSRNNASRLQFSEKGIWGCNTSKGGWAEHYGRGGEIVNRHHSDMLKSKSGGGRNPL